MAIVIMSTTHRICATCAFWAGPREDRGKEVSFNNRDSGICGGPSFRGWSMGAVSTCTFWSGRVGSGNRNGRDDSRP